ncbi:M15 family metallopeptidase [Mycobacterium sp.]|uniref:M15 family metallopeptidase n=1 Tax=Mycobacterium sp. TaxID=1785 RepID=UPI003A8B9859
MFRFGKTVLIAAAACLLAVCGGQPRTAGAAAEVGLAGTGWALRPPFPAGPGVPPVSAEAAAAGLVDVRTVVPDALVDLRYATANNFTRTQLYPADARCLVHQSMARGLDAAATLLRPQGQLLVFWDCYRPHDVQVKMYQVVPNPAWVARPGPYATSHVAARSVDVTFTDPHHGCPGERLGAGFCLADMGTDFDNFTDRAKAFATEGVSTVAQQNRTRLRDAMNYGGLKVYSGEWWHFDGPGAGVQRPILNVPVN